MFGLGNLIKNIGGSFVQKLAGKLLTEIPVLDKLATTALKLCDSLPLMKLRNFIKEKFGVDLKDFLKLTPLAPVATVMEARDLLAASIAKNGAPQKGTPEWSAWFNGARALAFDQHHQQQLRAAA